MRNAALQISTSSGIFIVDDDPHPFINGSPYNKILMFLASRIGDAVTEAQIAEACKVDVMTINKHKSLIKTTEKPGAKSVPGNNDYWEWTYSVNQKVVLTLVHERQTLRLTVPKDRTVWIDIWDTNPPYDLEPLETSVAQPQPALEQALNSPTHSEEGDRLRAAQRVLCDRQIQNDYFLGRNAVLKEIHDNFFGSGTTQAVSKQAITGIGGIGKTSVAVRYGSHYASRYNGHRFFCRANSEIELFDDYIAIATILAEEDENLRKVLRQRDAANFADLLRFSLHAYLTKNPGYLIIYDNADFVTESARKNLKESAASAVLEILKSRTAIGAGDTLDKILRDEKWLDAREQMTEKEFRTHLPERPAGHLLLTTRHSRFSDDLPIPALVTLDTLDPADAERFLITRVYGVNQTGAQLSVHERNEVTMLARSLGYFPLALEQAAAYIKARDCEYRWYREEVSRVSSALGSPSAGQLDVLERGAPRISPYRSTLRTTLQISLGAILAEATAESRAAIDMLHMASYLYPDSIERDLLIDVARGRFPAFDSMFEGINDEHLRQERFTVILSHLLRYSLVTRNPDRQSFRVHRLVQAAVRAALGEVAAYAVPGEQDAELA